MKQQQTKELELLKQLIGEWSVGIELVLVKWLSKDQFELVETASSFGKINLTTNYVFKRKET